MIIIKLAECKTKTRALSKLTIKPWKVW